MLRHQHVRGSHLAVLDDIRVQGCSTIGDFGHVTHRFALKLIVVLDHISLLQPTAVGNCILLILRRIYLFGLDVPLLAILLLRGHDLRDGLLLVHGRVHVFSKSELLLDGLAIHLDRVILLLKCVPAAWVSKRRILVDFVACRGVLYHKLTPRISYFFACCFRSTLGIDIWVLVWAILATLDLFWFKILGGLRLSYSYIHPLFWIGKWLFLLQVYCNSLLRRFSLDVLEAPLALSQLGGRPRYNKFVIGILLYIRILRYHYPSGLLIGRLLRRLPLGHVNPRVLVPAEHAFLVTCWAFGSHRVSSCNSHCLLWWFDAAAQAESNPFSLLYQIIFVLFRNLRIESQLQIFHLYLWNIIKFTIKHRLVYNFVQGIWRKEGVPVGLIAQIELLISVI